MRRMRVMAALLAGALMIGSIALPVKAETVSEEDWDKRESVHVTASASGQAQEVESEVTLRRKGSGVIPDKSDLKNIRNTEGDEEYTPQSGGTLYWENQGEDIHYKGDADPASLPMEVKITYTLDGAEIAPEALAGKSGHLTMRFDYENKLERTVEVDKKSYTVPVPGLRHGAARLRGGAGSQIPELYRGCGHSGIFRDFRGCDGFFSGFHGDHGCSRAAGRSG